MGYDYDGTIETLKQLKAERKDLLKRVLANSHDERGCHGHTSRI